LLEVSPGSTARLGAVDPANDDSKQCETTVAGGRAVGG
jgi:hypothetical protein